MKKTPTCYKDWWVVTPVFGTLVVLIFIVLFDSVTWQNVPPLYVNLAPEKLDSDVFFATDLAARTFWTVSTFVYIIAGIASFVAVVIFTWRWKPDHTKDSLNQAVRSTPNQSAKYGLQLFLISALLFYFIGLIIIHYELYKGNRDFFIRHTVYTLAQISCREEELAKNYEFITILIGLKKVNEMRKGQCDSYDPCNTPDFNLQHTPLLPKSGQNIKVSEIKWQVVKCRTYNTWWDSLVAKLPDRLDPNLVDLLTYFTVIITGVLVLGICDAISPNKYPSDEEKTDDEKTSTTTPKESKKAIQIKHKDKKAQSEALNGKEKEIDEVANDLERQQRRLLTLLYLGSVFLIAGVVVVYALLHFPVSFVSEEHSRYFHDAAVTGTAIIGVVFSVMFIVAYLPASMTLRARVQYVVAKRKDLHHQRQILSENRGQDSINEKERTGNHDPASSSQLQKEKDSFNEKEWLVDHGLTFSPQLQLVRAIAALSPLLLGLLQLLLS